MYSEKWSSERYDEVLGLINNYRKTDFLVRFFI